MKSLRADRVLTPDGWRDNIRLDIGADGRIAALSPADGGEDRHVAVLLPAPANLHSHTFQRAMAGMTERRGPDGRDSFWTWRQLMFRFLDHLTPEDVEAIAAFAFMEMLEAGYGAVAEFHYLHHQPGGAPFGDLAEMSTRIAAAAAATGIGLTLLPVLYQHGGCDGRPLSPGQIRFGNDPERFARLHGAAGKTLAALPADSRLGVAPHSLRAVDRAGLIAAIGLAPGGPIHIHAAEQVAEVEDMIAALGGRPVEWLLANAAVDARWCLVHATQMIPAETIALARSGAVAGLCPLTEASLGDGVFDGARFVESGGRFGFGTDSNISISLAAELRQLEYAQRLHERGRAVLADADRSTGRVLFDAAVAGGAQAAGRGAGGIAPGAWADLIGLDASAVDLEGKRGDDLLDAWIFAMTGNPVADLWSAGRHVVASGRHFARDAVTARYRATSARLRDRL
ncbi:MAG: formimidoylglutamate deiminase [Phyllobacteriaceae bacterium]|nr:formimidoylglutamate deiminase [Phyllobacteriaceae bacterium]